MEREGYGTDISSCRRDDLDAMAIERVETLSGCCAMDLCCGKGSMALEFMTRGAVVTAWDKIRPDFLLSEAPYGGKSLEIIVGDILDPDLVPHHVPFDVIVWQRAIHYLRPEEALQMMRRVRRWMRSGGSLYVSASGLGSELGNGYEGAGREWKDRWGLLSPDMREKHEIHLPVCLYEETDLVDLILRSGFELGKSFLSPFGNIKVVAHVE